MQCNKDSTRAAEKSWRKPLLDFTRNAVLLSKIESVFMYNIENYHIQQTQSQSHSFLMLNVTKYRLFKQLLFAWFKNYICNLHSYLVNLKLRILKSHVASKN